MKLNTVSLCSCSTAFRLHHIELQRCERKLRHSEVVPLFIMSTCDLVVRRSTVTGSIVMFLTDLNSSYLCLGGYFCCQMYTAVSVFLKRTSLANCHKLKGTFPAKHCSMSTTKISYLYLANIALFRWQKETAWLPGGHCSICVLWDECGYSLKQMALWVLQHSADAPRIDYSINIDICSELRDWNLQLDFEGIRRKCAHRLCALVDRHSTYTQLQC